MNRKRDSSVSGSKVVLVPYRPEHVGKCGLVSVRQLSRGRYQVPRVDAECGAACADRLGAVILGGRI